MPRSSGAVRARRYALARALADVVDGEGRPSRALEALAEFDRALTEEGTNPPDDDIHFAAGELLEDLDPARALQRYLEAVDGAAGEDSAERARRLLDSSSQPAALIASLSSETVDKVVQLAEAKPIPKPGPITSAFEKVTSRTVGTQPGQVALLASALLRQRGADEEALDVLRRAYDEAGPRARDVARQLAETQLDLDRVDEAVALVKAEDPNGRDARLQCIRAEAHLLRGEINEALQLSERLVGDKSASSAVAAVRALSLLGLSRLDEAVDALAVEDGTQLDGVRAVVRLQRREYAAAREASWSLLRAQPSDPHALLLSAQIVVEALGAPAEEETLAESGSSAHSGVTPGAELDAARRLLAEMATELPEAGPRSRWWLIQEAIRNDDARYRFFRSELLFARGREVGIHELDELVHADLTWLQQAAVQERIGEFHDKAGEDDRELAAAAYGEASALFASYAVDVERAAQHAREAYERAPMAGRANVYATRVLAASYEPADELGALDRLNRVIDGLGRWLGDGDAADDELARLVNLLAWVRMRIGELTIESGVERAPTLLEPLLAGVAVRPEDTVLRAALASQFLDLDEKAGAVVYAEDAFEASPDNYYVVETAVIASANYYGELEKVAPLLKRHAELSDDEGWRNAVELDVCITAGDLEGIERRHGRPVADAGWARREHAVATALLRGIPAATAELEEVLAATEESSGAHLDAVFLAAVLGRREETERHLAAARDDPNAKEPALLEGELVERFTFDPDFEVEAFFDQGLTLCVAPAEITWLVNVTLPLLVAARSEATGRVEPVPVGQTVLRAALSDFEDPRARFFAELERTRPALVPLARLADLRTELTARIAAEREARETLPNELSASVRKRIGAMIVNRAAAELPRRLLAARLGRGADVSHDDVRALFEGRIGVPVPTLLAAALLAHPVDAAGAKRLLSDATDADIAEGAGEMARTIEAAAAPAGTPAEEAIDDHWKVDALLRAVDDDASVAPALQSLATATREGLSFRLDQLLGLTWDESALEIPVVTPIVLEVGDDLVPIVDSSQDAGMFIEQLIPAMRARIETHTGVAVPGVRMRGDPTLPLDGYRIQVDEVPVVRGSVPRDATFAVLPPNNGRDPGGELTDVHPLTGEAGIWGIRPSREGENEDADRLTAAQYLINRIERVLREHLTRYLGVQEVASLIETWSADDEEGLVATVLADDDDFLRLTWVLQALVDEGVPITDWRAILTSVREVGGIQESTVSLRRNVRAALREYVPGREPGRAAVPVPDEHQRALLALTPDGTDGAAEGEPRHEFLRWLRTQIVETGPVLGLVTQTQDAREVVSALARTESRLIRTLSEDEVAAG